MPQSLGHIRCRPILVGDGRQDALCRLRELTTTEIGKLVSVSGVVTRTSEVRPELISGTFKCLDCATVIKDVEQQFKYTQVCGVLAVHVVVARQACSLPQKSLSEK